jgi:hypothetical protein
VRTRGNSDKDRKRKERKGKERTKSSSTVLYKVRRGEVTKPIGEGRQNEHKHEAIRKQSSTFSGLLAWWAANGRQPDDGIAALGCWNFLEEAW